MANLEQIANSTTSTVIVRITTIILPFLVAIIGWLAIDMLSNIKETQAKFWGFLGEQNKVLVQISTGQAVSNALFSSHAKDDDAFETTMKAAIADHEQRLRLIQAVPSRP